MGRNYRRADRLHLWKCMWLVTSITLNWKIWQDGEGNVIYILGDYWWRRKVEVDLSNNIVTNRKKWDSSVRWMLFSFCYLVYSLSCV
jgi:hypothetical protein